MKLESRIPAFLLAIVSLCGCQERKETPERSSPTAIQVAAIESHPAAKAACTGPYPDLATLDVVHGRVATLDDVNAGRAVFTTQGHPSAKPIKVDLPQYVCCRSEGKNSAGALIQAEEGPGMQIAGVRLADGHDASFLLGECELLGKTLSN